MTVQSVGPIPAGDAVDVTCLAGRRRCPPQDVGGPWGYQGFLAAIADPKHDLDPAEFDVDRVNLELAKLGRWSRPRN